MKILKVVLRSCIAQLQFLVPCQNITLYIIFEATMIVMKVTLNLLFLLLFSVVQANSRNGIDRAVFYKVLASGNAAEIEAQLTIVRESTVNEKNAYEGTLLMKKAQVVGKPKDKLSFFKAGRSKLETSISADKDNTEYRFLRLIIQEHAPKIVKYRKNLDEDIELIRSKFKNLTPEIQQIITDYSKKSSILKIS